MKNTTNSLMIALLILGFSHMAKSAPTTDASGKPRFLIAPGDVAHAAIEIPSGGQPAVVHLEFSSKKAAEFSRFTKKHINEQVQIMVGTNVVSEPVIRAEITSPKLDLSFSSADEARTVVNSLRKK